jgi:type II secretory pathway pseudopilin PulG
MQSYMPTKRNQSGFSAIEALLVVLIVVVLVIIGLVVYQRHKSTSAKTSVATNATQPQNTTTTQPAQATTPYLTLKEWGVKLPLSESIKDAYYVAEKGSSNGPGALPTTMWLGLTSLSSSSCNPSNNDNGGRGAVGAILRVLPTETDAVTGQLLTQKYPNGKTINGYYYTYQSWAKNNPCASDSTLQPIDSAFATAAKNMVLAPQYLEIKEWGIKIKLADADKITYTLGGTPNGSSANADAIVSWATLKLNNSVSTSDKCRVLGYEAEQLTAATNATKIGKYDYGFSGGTPDPCGDSTIDALRAKITSTELVDSAITAE